MFLFKVIKLRDRKKEDEYSNYQREVELLLWLVKLFNADPMLALHVSWLRNHSFWCR